MTPVSSRRANALFLLGAAALSAVMVALRWTVMDAGDPIAMPDTYWYAKYALVYAGQGEDQAAAGASHVLCAARDLAAVQLGHESTCAAYQPAIMEPAYERIFATRPGYALLAAPFVGVLGAWAGMLAVTAVLCLALGMLTYVAVRQLGGARPAALSGVVLLYLMPSGFWLTRMLSELPAMCGCLVALIGVTRLWRGRRGGVPVNIAVILAGLAVTVVCKSASGTALALALLAAAVVAWLPSRVPRRHAAWTAVAALGTVGVWVAVRYAWDLPSLNASIQDLASDHFRQPRVPDPHSWLLARSAAFWPDMAARLVTAPWPLILFVVGAAGLWRRDRALVWPYGFFGLSGFLLVAAHPDMDQAGRLLVTLWLPAAVGIAVGLSALAAASGRWRARPSRAYRLGLCG